MSKFFIKRPIVAMVIAILMVIVGAITILTLPVAQFPNIVPPEILLRANYPGADAQTLEQSVAAPTRQTARKRVAKLCVRPLGFPGPMYSGPKCRVRNMPNERLAFAHIHLPPDL